MEDDNGGKRREYKVRWKGYSAADDTWEPTSSFNDVDVVKKYEKEISPPAQARRTRSCVGTNK